MSLGLFRLLDPALGAAARRGEAAYLEALREVNDRLPCGGCRPVPLQLYHALPWLFRELYPELPDRSLSTVGASGLLYFQHVLILDRATDGDARPDGATLLAGAAMHERALTLLFPLLPPDTTAWSRLAEYVAAYAGAVGAEEVLRRERRSPDPVAYEAMARGKSSILKGSPLMGLAVAGRDPGSWDVLDAVLDPFALAVQLHDDLQDWREDVAAGRASLPLGRALRDTGAWDRWSRGHEADEEALAQALYHGGLAEEALEAAADAARRSAAAADEAGASGWSRVATLFGGRLDELAEGFARLRRRAGRVVASGVDDAGLAEAVVRGVRRLEKEHDRDFAEGRHVMRFPRSEGFTGAGIQEGEVFVRAVVGWVLGEVAAAGVPVARAALRENLERLLALRLADQEGGWSYFPDLPELPPDADDLAQVILAFDASAHPPSDGRELEGPTAVALGPSRRPDGAIATWLLDPDLPAASRRRYEGAIARHWGEDVSPEVVANLLFALHRRNPRAHADEILTGAAWVAGEQSEDGSWRSTWYEGPYYGTYVCGRLLHAVGGYASSLGDSASFLLENQGEDGGWGTGRRSDPLSTALALCALVAFGDVVPGDAVRRAAARGAGFLVLSQRDRGGWPPAPLVRMDLRRARDDTPAWVHHGSQTLTTAFAVQALQGVRSARVEVRT